MLSGLHQRIWTHEDCKVCAELQAALHIVHSHTLTVSYRESEASYLQPVTNGIVNSIRIVRSRNRQVLTSFSRLTLYHCCYGDSLENVND